MPSYTYYNASVRAGWSRFYDSEIVCLLVSQIAVHLFVNAPKLPLNGNLLFLSIAQGESRSQIDSVPFQTKSSSKPSKNGAAAAKLTLATELLNITLTASLGLLANDVSPNPGPGALQPLKVKGLRIFHINICSLSLFEQ